MKPWLIALMALAVVAITAPQAGGKNGYSLSLTVCSASEIGCDFRADGTDDQVEIQAAIDALGDGGNVLLTNGAFDIRDTINVATDNITLEGTSLATVLLVPAGFAFPGAAIIDIGDNAAAYRGIVVRNLQIDGSRASTVGAFGGIRSRWVSHLNIEDVLVHSTRGTGIAVLGHWSPGLTVEAEYVTVRRTAVYDNLLWGIQTRYIIRSQIVENRVYGNLGYDVSDPKGGILFDDTRYSILADNISYGNAQAGIAVWSVYNTIRGNIVTDNGAYGFYVRNSEHNTVTGNLTEGNPAKTGLYLYDEATRWNAFTGNVVRDGLTDNGQGNVIVGSNMGGGGIWGNPTSPHYNFNWPVGPLNLGPSREVTVSAGATIGVGWGWQAAIYRVDTYLDAPTDDLIRINGCLDGDVVILRAESDARTVVVRHETNEGINIGNLSLNGQASFNLDSVKDRLTLQCDGALGLWLELARGDNG